MPPSLHTATSCSRRHRPSLSQQALVRGLSLASMQTLARKSRRERLIAAQAEAGMFTTIIIDEAHHVLATSYLDFLDAMEDAIGPDDEGPLVLGATATPARAGVADEGRAARADALDVAKERRDRRSPTPRTKGEPMTTPALPIDQRLDRLEDAVVALTDFAVENQRVRFTRSVAGGGPSSRVLTFLDAIEAERATALTRASAAEEADSARAPTEDTVRPAVGLPADEALAERRRPALGRCEITSPPRCPVKIRASAATAWHRSVGLRASPADVTAGVSVRPPVLASVRPESDGSPRL